MEIVAKNISKSFSGITILKSLDLVISSGKTTAIIGPNGAGKTTLLKILSLLIKPDGGELLYAGKKISELNQHQKLFLRRKMVYVSQHPIVFSGSVYENVAYGLKIRKEKNISQKVENILQELHLFHLAERNANHLSGGEKHRLGLARALILNSEVIFLDEPTTNLDPLSIKITEEIIEKLSAHRRTVVFATHNLILARHFADYIYFLAAGKIIQKGFAEEIFQIPNSFRIAEFIGTPNILTGEIIDEGTFLTDGIKIFITGNGKSQRGSIIIRPEEIFVSLEPIIHSSARNCLRGTIQKIKPVGLLRELKVQISPKNFLTVLITAESEQKMGLIPNKEVYLIFKVTAVHLLKELE